MIIKRFNMLRYYDAFSQYDKEQIEGVIYSLLEHNISDLGFDIELKTVDLRPFTTRLNLDMDIIIANLVEISFLLIPSSYKAEIKTITPYIYEVHLR